MCKQSDNANYNMYYNHLQSIIVLKSNLMIEASWTFLILAIEPIKLNSEGSTLNSRIFFALSLEVSPPPKIIANHNSIHMNEWVTLVYE